jgi:hypothetical protein
LKEKKASTADNIIRFAKRKHIKQPEELTMEELKDGLQFCQIRKAELRKQTKGLWKVHLRDCLLDVQSKRQKGISNQAKAPSRRKQADLVSNKKDGQRSSQLQHPQSPENN